MEPPPNPLLAVLRGRPGARVPFQEPEVSPLHVNAVLGRPANCAASELPPADYAAFTLATGQSALWHNALWKAGRRYQADHTGRRHYVDGLVKGRADFAKIDPFPLEPAVERIAALARAARTHGLAVIISFPSPFRLALFAVGYTDFCLQLHDNPAFIRALIDHFQEASAAYLPRLLELPVDAFFLGGTICVGAGPILAPRLIEQLWLPGIQEFLRPIVARDLPIVLHMDGDFSSLADLLLTLPLAAIHPFEVTGRLDIRAFQKAPGARVAVWGNLDVAGVLGRGTPAEVTADAREHLRQLAGDGRYILASSHEISADVPLANFQALVAAAREFGGRTTPEPIRRLSP